MPWLAAATVAAPIVGGLVGNLMSQGDRSAQKKAMKQAYAELQKVGYPPDLSKELIVKEFERQGVYTPEIEEDLNSSMPESETGKIKEDTELREAQKQALSAMQQRAKVGLSAEDRAALNQVRSEVQRDAEAKRQQVLQQMQARGMGGSGAALVAQLQAGQDAQNLASQQSDQVMAQAQQRALQALGQSSDMASQVRGQDFNVNQARAQALDERNRFLQENSIARQRQNVQTLNEAQRANLAEQQRIAEANITRQREEQLRQTQEKGNLYDRSLDYGQSKANALNGLASAAGQRAANTAASYGQMGTGLGTAAGALGNAKEDSVFGKYFSGKAEHGGIVGDPETAGGATKGSDNVNMDLREGEMVLNAEQQKALFDFIDRLSKKYK